MISAITHNLDRGIKLLNAISDKEYSDNSVAPYYSSIGIHMRHILDVFDCIFEGLETKKVNLAARKRNELAEVKVNIGLIYFEDIIKQLHRSSRDKFDLPGMIAELLIQKQNSI